MARAPDADDTVRLMHKGLPAGAGELHGQGWTLYRGRLEKVATGRDPGPDPNARARTRCTASSKRSAGRARRDGAAFRRDHQHEHDGSGRVHWIRPGCDKDGQALVATSGVRATGTGRSGQTQILVDRGCRQAQALLVGRLARHAVESQGDHQAMLRVCERDR